MDLIDNVEETDLKVETISHLSDLITGALTDVQAMVLMQLLDEHIAKTYKRLAYNPDNHNGLPTTKQVQDAHELVGKLLDLRTRLEFIATTITFQEI